MNRVLVYGASSDQGIPLINALIRKGYYVRAATRNPEKYKNEITRNIETIKADLYDIETLKEASKGVDSIAMNLPFVFDKNIAKEWGLNIISAATDMGVRKIVFNTSCYVASKDNGIEAHDGRRQIESAIENSGMDYVVIRSLVFMDNLLRFWSKPSIVNHNIFAYPCDPNLKISWICLEDVATFMVAALSSDDLKKDKILVGGPEILVGDEVAQRFTNALGREIKFSSLKPKNFAASMSKLITGSEEYEEVSIYAGMAAFYSWYNKQDPSPLAVDMNYLYKKLKIKPTYFENWIKQHDWDNI